jgi:hypothetical protein
VRNNATANSMQIGEIELLGVAGQAQTGPSLTITRSNNNITVTWTGGVLQSAPAVNGPWTPVAGATGGTHTQAIGTGNQFFRAVQP